MNVIDLKISKIVIFLNPIQHFKNPKMLFDGFDVYLQHTLNSVPW